METGELGSPGLNFSLKIFIYMGLKNHALAPPPMRNPGSVAFHPCVWFTWLSRVDRKKSPYFRVTVQPYVKYLYKFLFIILTERNQVVDCVTKTGNFLKDTRTRKAISALGCFPRSWLWFNKQFQLFARDYLSMWCWKAHLLVFHELRSSGGWKEENP